MINFDLYTIQARRYFDKALKSILCLCSFSLAIFSSEQALAEVLPTPDLTKGITTTHRRWARAQNKSFHLGAGVEFEYFKIDATDKVTFEKAKILSKMNPKISAWIVKELSHNYKVSLIFAQTGNEYLPDENTGNDISSVEKERLRYSLRLQKILHQRFSVDFAVGNKSVPYVRALDLNSLTVDINDSIFTSVGLHLVPLQFDHSALFVYANYQYLFAGENSKNNYKYEASSALDISLGYEQINFNNSIVYNIFYANSEQEFDYATQKQSHVGGGISFTMGFE